MQDRTRQKVHNSARAKYLPILAPTYHCYHCPHLFVPSGEVRSGVSIDMNIISPSQLLHHTVMHATQVHSIFTAAQKSGVHLSLFSALIPTSPLPRLTTYVTVSQKPHAHTQMHRRGGVMRNSSSF